MNDEPLQLLVDGIVARRDHEPYVRLMLDGKPIVQLSMAEARKIAHDILILAARTEADAMILRFFSDNEYPAEAGAALMMAFRDFRLKLDREPVKGSHIDPDTGAPV